MRLRRQGCTSFIAGGWAAFAVLAAASCGGSSSAGAPDATAVGDGAGPGSDGSAPMDATTDGPAGSREGGPEDSAASDDASPAGGDATMESGVPIGEVGVDSGDAQSTGSLVFVACPGPLAPDTATALKAGGAVDPAMSWLYPYSGTVFPAGLQGPILQWVPQSGGTAAALLHMHSRLFDYQGCFVPSNPGQLAVPNIEWAVAAAQSSGASDPLTVELTTSSSTGVVSGPITETWTLARGPLAGAVYYDTYGSKLGPSASTSNGAVMKLVPGAAQPTAFLTTAAGATPFGPCVSCHAVAASGSLLATEEEFFPGGDPLYGKGSESFALTATSQPDAGSPLASTLNDSWGLSAVYPDGSLLLTSGEPADSTASVTFPSVAGNNPGMIGPKKTAMYSAMTGATIAFSGLSAQYATMPMFSPDGKHVVYNDYDAGSGHTLTVMDFDVSTKKFSNAVAVFHDATLYPGWPSFTPDSQWVVFALGSASNYATETPPTASPVNSSQLYIVSAAGGTAQRLDGASGYAGGQTYLPAGSADNNLDFYPNVSPVASGGYFWVYFTSRRSYGNLYSHGSADVGSKAIWMAAIDIGVMSGHDPSHPAFYLPGQELGSGAVRATAVLAPCASNGASCTSGFDCCGGTCTAGQCAPPSGCSIENNRCSNSADCCDDPTPLRCIGGYCAFDP
ncbi:MAG TPA: hypothetical protein VK762_05015 [Polyangiaceae bacterium]|jgi:hypothetical protein|nr:hypothetical protein [Polyangiaceae bacterium]